MIRPLLLGGVVLMLASCAEYPLASMVEHVRIEVGPGPEDMALDTLTSEPRLIISCAERRTENQDRNGFYVYNLNDDKEVKALAIVDLPDSVELHPHGIDVAHVGGRIILYAVNHERNRKQYPPKGRQSILMFELTPDTLYFLELLTGPAIISPNDVCSDHSGGIYVSNDSGKRNRLLEKLFALRRSTVVHFDGNDWKFVGQKLRYANGVGVKGQRLYITGTQEKHLISYRILADGSLDDERFIPAPKGSDNITFYDEHLVSTAHPDFFRFIKHVGNAEKPSPSLVYTIDLQSLDQDTLMFDNGTTISAASTAIIVDGYLYVSQIFEPYILRVSLKK